MKKEENFWDKLVKGLYIGLILFICLLFMIILFSTKGHCASEQDYFPMFQNNNSKFTEPLINYIENTLNSNDNYIFCSYSGIGNPNSPNYKTYEFLYISIPKNSNTMLYGEKYNDLIHFSLYKVGSANPTGGYIKYNPHFGTFDNITYSGILNYFQNLTSSNYDNNKDYVSNFKVMTNNTPTAQVVLFYDDGVTIPDGDTARDDMEKPDINDYIPSWDNKPSFDGSSVENALSSIWDITVWTAENTRDTIKGVGQFIGDTLRWTSQKIIDSIRSKIDEIKTSIVNAINSVTAFVQDIKGFVSYVAEPLDVSSVQSTITGSTAYGDVSTITGAFADFKGVFDSTSEPSEYKIPIHLENIPILNQTQAQYFDLSVMANQRPLIRAFCWVVTTFSLFVTVVDALPNYLKGGDE